MTPSSEQSIEVEAWICPVHGIVDDGDLIEDIHRSGKIRVMRRYGWYPNVQFEPGDRVEFIGTRKFLWLGASNIADQLYGIIQSVDDVGDQPAESDEYDDDFTTPCYVVEFEGFEDEGPRFAFHGQLKRA